MDNNEAHEMGDTDTATGPDPLAMDPTGAGWVISPESFTNAATPDYSRPTEDCDYAIDHFMGTNRYVATCLACGHTTAPKLFDTSARNEIIDHVYDDWSSRP